MPKYLLPMMLLLILGVSQVSAQTPPTFTRTPCPVAIPFDFTEDANPNGIECGFVTVPEFHGQPDSRQIQVAVAIIHSASPNPADDPVFMEQGGPGGSTLELFIPAAYLFEQILGQRDIILVEQRGTLHSQPSLMCPEIFQTSIENLDQDLSLDVYLDAYGRCFDRLRSEGVNLSAYNSVENAADIISVADALGYDEINFYGVSYGTMLGQHLLRDHEDRLRSIIFDAVVPLELNFLTESSVTAEESLQAIFMACRANVACNRRYPDLETVTYNTVATLNANPVMIPVYDPTEKVEYPSLFNGNIFLRLLRSIQYNTSLVPSIPAFIDASANGDFEWVEQFYGVVGIESARTFADAMYMSVLCAEDADFTAEDLNLTSIRSEFVNNQLFTALSILQGCQLAQVDALEAYVDDPVQSDVPALILSGQFDPITPERYANVLAVNLPNATNISFPGVGHGAMLSGACPLQIVSLFIFTPEFPVDTSCSGMLPVFFHEFSVDPTGRLAYPIPTDLIEMSTERYASYVNSYQDLRLSIIAVDSPDLDTATREALTTVVRPDFSGAPFEERIDNYVYGDVLTGVYIDGSNFILTQTSTVQSVTSVVVVEIFSQEALGDVLFYVQPIVSTIYSRD